MKQELNNSQEESKNKEHQREVINKKLIDLQKKIAAIDKNNTPEQIAKLLEEISDLAQEASKYGIAISIVGLEISIASTGEELNKTQWEIANPKLIEEMLQEKDVKLLVDRNSEQATRAEEVEKTVAEYTKDKGKEIKALQDIRERIENKEDIPIEQLCLHVKSKEEIEQEKQKVKEIQKFHKDVHDHNNSLISGINKLNNDLHPDNNLPEEDRQKTYAKISILQKLHKEHQPTLVKANAAHNEVNEKFRQYGESLIGLSNSTQHLPADHPHRKFVKVKLEEHAAVAGGQELPNNPHREQFVNMRRTVEAGTKIKNHLTNYKQEHATHIPNVVLNNKNQNKEIFHK